MRRSTCLDRPETRSHHPSLRASSAGRASRTLPLRFDAAPAAEPPCGPFGEELAVLAVRRLWKKSARTWFPPAAFPAVPDPGVVGIVEVEVPDAALCCEGVRERKLAAEG